MLKAGIERGDSYEEIVDYFDAHKRRAVAEAKAYADVFAAAQRLKGKFDARVTAFNASFTGVIEGRCRAIEAEYDVLIREMTAENDGGSTETSAEVEALRKERERKVSDLWNLVDVGEFGPHNTRDSVFIAKCTRRLKLWTGKSSATIIYDSTVDGFTADGLFNKVKGKRNIALVGFTTEGDVFGGFYQKAVTQQDKEFNDPAIFAFSFESHGRCDTPKRFVVKENVKENALVLFEKKDKNGFVVFYVNMADSSIRLGNERSESNCWNVSSSFEGLEDTTLTGKDGTFDEGPYHHCTRLVAVQLS